MQNCAELLVAQQLAYTFLGKVFYEVPSEDFIRVLITDDLFDDWPLESEERDVETGLALLHEFSTTPSVELIGPLVRDYNRLFVVPGDGFVRPWESVYRSKDHILFERETLEVRQQYQRFGMPIPRLDVEPEDHLGLELRFIAHLCSLGLVALECGRVNAFRHSIEGMRDFINGHLSLWANECLGQVIAHADTAFYRGAAYLTQGCIEETRKILRLQADDVP